jgi:hypothetical protein
VREKLLFSIGNKKFLNVEKCGFFDVKTGGKYSNRYTSKV